MRPDRRSPSPGLCFPDLVDGGQLPDQRHSRGGYQSWPLNCQRGGVRTDLASMSVRLYGRVVGCVLVGWRARDRRACPWSCSDIARCLAPKADLRANHGRAVWAERALQHGPEGTSYAARRPLTARGERTKERPSLASGFDTPAETLAKVQDLLCPILCPFYIHWCPVTRGKKNAHILHRHLTHLSHCTHTTPVQTQGIPFHPGLDRAEYSTNTER